MKTATDTIHNISTWRSLGYKPKTGERPAWTVEHGYGRTSHMYREDQVRPIAKRKKPEPKPLPVTIDNVLSACWTVNRTAKRYRDAASSCFASRRYSFATANRERKEECYWLKDRAIRWLIKNEAIKPEGRMGPLTVWRGSGYTFHALLGPAECNELSNDGLFVEAKLKTNEEMRLIDATALIKALPHYEPADMVECHFPARPSKAISRVNYGEVHWEDEEGDDDWY